MEQHALAAFEIADYLYVPEFGKLNMLGDAPSARRVLRHRSQPGRPLVKAIVYDVVGARRPWFARWLNPTVPRTAR